MGPPLASLGVAGHPLAMGPGPLPFGQIGGGEPLSWPCMFFFPFNDETKQISLSLSLSHTQMKNKKKQITKKKKKETNQTMGKVSLLTGSLELFLCVDLPFWIC